MKKPLLRKLRVLLLLTAFCFTYNGSRGQSPPNLGAASSFAVFTAVGAFDNLGTTYIIGDIGTNAGAFSGFPPGTVVGQIHVADPVSTQAAADVNTAYSYLSGINCGMVIGTTLGNNQVLTPDVYCLGGAATLNGNLILDAQGDPNALFIFKINGALSTSTFSNVILVNGASLCNVYWQVNGAFSLGDGSVFRGTLLVNGAISLLEASSLYGQALSRAGAVDLHNNYIAIGRQPVVVVAAAGNNTTICAGDSVVLTASVSNATGPYTYLWSPGGETDSTITVFPTVTTQYIVTVNAPNGCGDGVDTIVVTVNPPATVDAGPDQTICLDTSVTLAGSVGGSATGGTWTGGSGTFTPSNTTLNAEYTPSAAEVTAGTVTLTLTTNDPAGACAAASDNVTITISPSATADAGPDQTVCINTPVTLAGSVGASATGGTWSGGTGTFSPNNTTLNAQYTPSAAEVTAGSVTLTLTTNDPPGSCGPGSDMMIITISPSATADAGPDQVICEGSPVTLAGSIGPGAMGGTWSGGTGTFTPNNTTLNAQYTPSAAEVAAGSVTLVLTTDDPAGSCAAGSDSVTITINFGATVNAGAGQVICAGSSVTLSGSVGGTATSGMWTGGTGMFSPNNTTLNAEYTPGAADIAAGSVVLTLTTNDPAGPCPAVSDTVTIIINPAANVNAGPDQAICPDTTVTLSGSIGGAATGATWSGGTGTFSPNNTTLNAVYTPSAAEITAGSVTLVLTTNDPAGACTAASDSVRIIISPAPTANAGPDQIICEGSSVTLSGSIGGAAMSGTWSGGAGIFSPNNTTLNAQYTPSMSEITAGSVTLVLTTNDPPGSCTPASDSVLIIINPTDTLDAGPDQVICVGATVSLSGSATSGVWSGGTGTFSPNDTTLNAVYTPSAGDIAAGSVMLILASNDTASICTIISDTMVITISPVSTANAGPDQIICEGDSVSLSGTVGGSATGGVWSGGTGTFSPNDSTLNAVYIPSSGDSAAGSAVLTLTTYGGLCAPANDQVTITINPSPSLDLGPDTIMCGCITLNAGSPSLTIIWSNGSIYPSITVCTGGTYWVTVSNGLCIVSDTITIIPPFVDLGNDTVISGPIVLNAGHTGSAFIWNTGDTTQTITVTLSGTYIVTVTDTMGCTFSDTINITVGTGINDVSGQPLLDIYPNPNNGNIWLEYFIPGGEQGELVVYDVAGRIVLRSMLEKGADHAAISAGSLDNGSYFCRLISNDKTIAQKKMIIIK